MGKVSRFPPMVTTNGMETIQSFPSWVSINMATPSSLDGLLHGLLHGKSIYKWMMTRALGVPL